MFDISFTGSSRKHHTCKATSGDPCIFPFKDEQGYEHNACYRQFDRSECAAEVDETGAWKSNDHCSSDCPNPPGDRNKISLRSKYIFNEME